MLLLSSFSKAVFFFFLLLLLLNEIPISFSIRYTINVCQNKNCLKKFPKSSGENLKSLFRNLICTTSQSHDSIAIEASGCLSRCVNGPNIRIESDDSTKEYNKISDPQIASAVLETLGFHTPDLLLAASDVIGQAYESNSPEQKEALLSSVITVLQSSEFASSPALSSSFVQRADVRLVKTPCNVDGAVNDSIMATQIDPQNGKSWRLLAEANEAAGNVEDALMALRIYASLDSRFATKAKKEISRLSELK